MDKKEISIWVDANRKNVRFVQSNSFRDAAMIIAHDLYKIQQPSETELKTIIAILHGNCYCKSHIESLPSCPQCGKIVLIPGDRTASCATEPGVRELRQIVLSR